MKYLERGREMMGSGIEASAQMGQENCRQLNEEQFVQYQKANQENSHGNENVNRDNTMRKVIANTEANMNKT